MVKKLTYDCFISYSRKDIEFARKLEKALERYRPAKGLGISKKNLQIFRDEQDMTGTEYFQSVTAHLNDSEKLIVICSPNARNSNLVDDEIRRFCELKDPQNIISILVDGIPNNEANAEQKNQMAFPKALCNAMEMPLAIDYLGFSGSKNKLNKGFFENSWHTLLANIYNLSRNEIEQREKKKQMRQRTLTTVIAGIFFMLLVLILYVWQSKNLKIANEQLIASQAREKSTQDSLARLAAEKDKQLAQEREKEEITRRKLANSLQLIADAYKILYQEPTQAVIKAFDASVINPTQESKLALRNAYKVALYHLYNRQETSKMTGSGPAYLAHKWKQTPLFTEFSPDGRFQLIVTDRGKDGPKPPGDVFLLNNETLKLIKLVSCGNIGGRAEDVGFSNNSDRIFITRYFNLGVYSLEGKCVGEYYFGRYTKSPVHIVEGIFLGKYLICGETKGGLYLIDPDKPEESAIELQREWNGDAALNIAISPNGQYAIVVFESGRISLIYKSETGKPQMEDVLKKNGYYAGFNPTQENQFGIAGEDGLLQIWQISQKIKKIKELKIGDYPLDWISFAEDGNRLLAVSSNHTLFIIDSKSGNKIYSLNYSDEIDWADPKTVAVNPINSKGSLIHSTCKLSMLDSSLRISETFKIDSNRWLIGKCKPDSILQSGLLKIENDSLLFFRCRLPRGTMSIKSIKQANDNLVWFKEIPFMNASIGGPLFHVKSKQIVQLPKKGIDVRLVLVQDSILWLGTDKGLFEVKENNIIRRTDEDLEINDCKLINDKLWLGTDHGAYVLENDRLIKLTDRSIKAREITEVANKIWILTGTSGMFGESGPAYLVSGYFTKAVPNSESEVDRVYENQGQINIDTKKGTYIFAKSTTHPIPKPEISFPKLFTKKTIKTANDTWILYGKLWGFGTAARLVGNDTLNVNLGEISVKEMKEINGEIWLLTDHGAFCILNNKPIRTPNLDVAVNSALLIKDEIWLLVEKGAIKLRDKVNYTLYSTGEYTPKSIKLVGSQLWLLTNATSVLPNYNFGDYNSTKMTNAPAYRIENDKIFAYNVDSLIIKDVFDYNKQFWMLTEKERKPGPLIKADQLFFDND